MSVPIINQSQARRSTGISVTVWLPAGLAEYENVQRVTMETNDGLHFVNKEGDEIKYHNVPFVVVRWNPKATVN